MYPSPSRYQHRIVCLNGAEQTTGKYQLQISEINHQGRCVQRAKWHFCTVRGLTAFLKRHFPESELLQQDLSRCIEFQVVPLAQPQPLRERTVEFAFDMPRQLQPDRVTYSTLPALVKASCG